MDAYIFYWLQYSMIVSPSPTMYTLTSGPMCEMAGVTMLPFGHCPLMLYNGEVSCQTLSGKISIMRLNTHSFGDEQELTEKEVL